MRVAPRANTAKYAGDSMGHGLINSRFSWAMTASRIVQLFKSLSMGASTRHREMRRRSWRTLTMIAYRKIDSAPVIGCTIRTWFYALSNNYHRAYASHIGWEDCVMRVAASSDEACEVRSTKLFVHVSLHLDTE